MPPSTPAHPRLAYHPCAPPGVRNHYLTFITSYERRNLFRGRFSLDSLFILPDIDTPLTDPTNFPIRKREFKMTTILFIPSNGMMQAEIGLPRIYRTGIEEDDLP